MKSAACIEFDSHDYVHYENRNGFGYDVLVDEISRGKQIVKHVEQSHIVSLLTWRSQRTVRFGA